MSEDHVHNRTGGEMFDLPVSTLRYYDKQRLFPELERTSGIRRFGDTELEALRVIECLKKAGMEIKDIRLFMEWCAEGPSTYPKRKAMFEERKAHMESEIAKMNRTLDMLKFKCWYYEQAIQDGNENRVKALIPDDLPEEIKGAYENAHAR
ncbi:MAG: MerR family transcriptional regulator [Adlercreutzia equolifaciens]